MRRTCATSHLLALPVLLLPAALARGSVGVVYTPLAFDAHLPAIAREVCACTALLDLLPCGRGSGRGCAGVNTLARAGVGVLHTPLAFDTRLAGITRKVCTCALGSETACAGCSVDAARCSAAGAGFHLPARVCHTTAEHVILAR